MVRLLAFLTPLPGGEGPLPAWPKNREGQRPCAADRKDGRRPNDFVAAAGLDRPAGIGSNSGVGCPGRRRESGVGWPASEMRHRVGKVLLASSRPDFRGRESRAGEQVEQENR